MLFPKRPGDESRIVRLVAVHLRNEAMSPGFDVSRFEIGIFGLEDDQRAPAPGDRRALGQQRYLGRLRVSGNGNAGNRTGIEKRVDQAGIVRLDEELPVAVLDLFDGPFGYLQIDLGLTDRNRKAVGSDHDVVLAIGQKRLIAAQSPVVTQHDFDRSILTPEDTLGRRDLRRNPLKLRQKASQSPSREPQ